MKRLVLLLVGFQLLFSSCLRDDLSPCPPLQVTVGVKDKNYFNIDAVVSQGIAEKKDKDLPFRSYVSTLYYSLKDLESGKEVVKQSTFTVEGDAREYDIVFPESLPYGRYALTIWGNLKSDEPLHEGSTSAELEKFDAVQNDIYMTADTLEYDYGKEKHYSDLERTKGKLLVQAVNLPAYVDFSTKDITNVYSVVNSDFSYLNAITVSTRTHWQKPGSILTETLLCPSVSKEKSNLDVVFYDYSTISRDVVSHAPHDIKITMGRNEITVVKYVYDEIYRDFNIYILVNDNWESEHEMEVG